MPTAFARRAVAVVVAALVAGALGCATPDPETRSRYRSAKGFLLEPIPMEELHYREDAKDLAGGVMIQATANPQRWPNPGAVRAERELTVGVVFLTKKGKPVERSAGAVSFCVRRYDLNTYDHMAERFAAFHAQASDLESAWQSGAFAKRYAFRLALRKNHPLVAAPIWKKDNLTVVVDIQFDSEDGTVLRTRTAPVRLRNR